MHLRGLAQGSVVHIADDSDNRLPGIAKSPADSLADGVLPGPEFRSQRLAYHGDGLRADAVCGLKGAAPEQRNAHCVEIVPQHPCLAKRLRLTARSCRLALDLNRNRQAGIEG